MTTLELEKVQAATEVRRPQENRSTFKMELILVGVTFIWGSTFLVVQNSIKSIEPFSFLALRFAVAALTLALIFHKRVFRMTRRELIGGSIVGVMLFGGYAFQTTALQFTDSSKVAFINGLYVPMVPIAALVLLRQLPTFGAVLGVITSFVGMTLLSVNDSFKLSLGLGEWLALGCAIAFGLHIIGISKFAPKADAINLATVQIAVTSLLSAIAIPFAGEKVVMPSPESWGSVVFMGVIATALALGVMNWVQKYISSTRATLIYALELVWAGLIGALAGENLTLTGFIGCGLIMLGMLTGELRLKKLFSFAIREKPAV